MKVRRLVKLKDVARMMKVKYGVLVEYLDKVGAEAFQVKSDLYMEADELYKILFQKLFEKNKEA